MCNNRLSRRLVLWVAAVSVGVPSLGRGAPAPAAPPEAVVKLNAGYAAVESALRTIPRDSFDPQALIERVGRDEGKLFAFVRDRTYWVPYLGVLRGATGVLQDRVGSSLDRALLLAELLRVSGYEVRLAHATLDDARAGELVGQVRPVPAGWRGAIAAAGAKAGEPTEAEKKVMDGAAARVAFGTQRVEAQAGQLAAAMPAPAADAAKEKARAVEAIKDHWWVQRKNGAEWVDLDPLLPAAAVGAAVAKSDKTLTAPTADGKLALPAELCHEVDVQVIVEKWDAGKTTEAVAVKTTLRAAEAFDRRVSVDHVPIAWPKKLSDKRPEPKEFNGAVRATVEWMPVIYVNGGSVTDKSVTTAGDLVDHPKLESAAKIGQAVGGLFGGGLTGGDAPKAATSHLTAEWLQYTIRAPGRAPVTVRREVFDLLGPAAREKAAAAAVPAPTVDDRAKLERGLSLLAQTDVLVLSCQPTAEFVTYNYLKNLLGTRTPVQRGLVGSDGKKRARDFADRSVLLFNPLWYVALNRVELSPSGRDVYLATANVFQYRTRQVAGATDGDPLKSAELVDLSYNAVAVRPGADRPAFAVRVEQGVADTVAEAMPLDGGKTPVANTAWVFAANNAAPVKAAADVPAGFTPDAAARLRQTLATGQAALVTPAPAQIAGAARVGWWRVDPATGDTVGVMDDGYHAATTERQQLEDKVNALLRVPFRIALEEVKEYTQAEFIEMILGGKNLSGLQLLRAFQTSARLYEMILAL